ncbi:hypothetical protein BC829DRAFT_493039 [Chytridium lagenaria]|nr:hypothetical protein BC829DRAFT_493039 [Chytridium lagenaria]
MSLLVVNKSSIKGFRFNTGYYNTHDARLDALFHLRPTPPSLPPTTLEAPPSMPFDPSSPWPVCVFLASRMLVQAQLYGDSTLDPPSLSSMAHGQETTPSSVVAVSTEQQQHLDGAITTAITATTATTTTLLSNGPVDFKSEPNSRSTSSISLSSSPVIPPIGIHAMALTPSGKPKVPMKWSSTTNNTNSNNISSSSPSSNPLPLRTSTFNTNNTASTSAPPPLNIHNPSSSSQPHPPPLSTTPSMIGGTLPPLDEDAVVAITPTTSTRNRSSSALATPLSASAPEPGKITKRLSVRSRSEGSGIVTDAPAPTTTLRRGLTRQRSDKEVLVGTPVKEGHVNYMLMYDMLTGIRVSVSRCNAKPTRPLEEGDFEAAHKLAFDVTGNELTPSSRYDFKFKDYAPWAFRLIRESFCVDAAEYLLSLTGKYVLSELGSPGKSGSFFYFSQDYRFIIKTIHHSEHKFMRKILPNYYAHIKDNPQTLLSRIFGLHRVKLPGNRKIHFVVMGNVFPPNKDIHETYDLKGSTVGRRVSDKEVKENPRAVLKDLNWVERGRKLKLGPQKSRAFVEQMEKDVAFLVSMKIMDYSLLIGYHDLVKGNADNIRDATLSVFGPTTDPNNPPPQTPTLSRSQTGPLFPVSTTPLSPASATFPTPTLTIRRGSKASALRRNLVETDPVRLGPSSAVLPDDSPPERTTLYENVMEVYYVGIIDVFTRYSAGKKMEHFFKALGSDGKKSVPSIQPLRLPVPRIMKNAISKPGDPPAHPSVPALSPRPYDVTHKTEKKRPPTLRHLILDSKTISNKGRPL